MKYFKEDRPSYNLEHSKGESVYQFLFVDIKTLYDGVSQFKQIRLILKVLEATGMEYFNGLLTPTKVEAPLGTYANGYEANRDWNNSYDSVIGMMLYLASNRNI